MNRFLNFFNPTQWYILLAVAAAFLAAAGAGALYVHGIGKDAGRAEIQAKWDEESLQRERAHSRSLLNQAEKVATLSNQLMEAQRVQSKSAQDLAAARGRADAAGRRLRDQAATNELAARVAAAERGVVNTFAARAFSAAVACRDDLAEIGLGAGGLVEASASAHYEHARAEALMNFTMPTPPTGPFGDRQ